MVRETVKWATSEEIKHINALVPKKAKIIKIIKETLDITTFHISSENGRIPFDTAPGQLVMLSLLGVGEGMFSVTNAGDHLEISVKKTGVLTDALHEVVEGQTVGIRGAYGNGFPVDFCRGKNLLFIAGGIGLAPVRSLIHHAVKRRDEFGSLHLIYGSRSLADLVYKTELFETWPAVSDFKVSLTVDHGDDEWQGNVGFVPAFVEQIQPSVENTACILCGPPIMIKYTLGVLDSLGFSPENIFTTLEMRMKCGIGKCGRCNIGSCYVCLDGPVFSLAQLKCLPNEF